VIDYPLELHLATASQLFPAIAALRFAGRLPAVRWWFLAWCLLSFLADGAQLLSAHIAGSNLWLRLVTHPLRAALLFWTLSLWQLEPKPQRMMRQAIVIFIPVTLAVALLWEGAASFGDKSGPILQLGLLAGCVYTLVSRSVAATERLAREDWFWITLGLSLYFALNVALAPTAMALLRDNVPLLKQVLLFKARADILAFILMTVGMLCPLPRNLSLKPT